jgi:hypothetical protein
MNRPLATVLIVLFLTGWAVGAAGQKAPAVTMNELSAVLASSCANQPALTLAADGTIVRKDRNGATMTFKLQDIGAIAIDAPDAEANVLLRCRDDKPCVQWKASAGEAATPAKLVVFSVSPPEAGDLVAKLFKDLQAALTSSVSR